MRDLRSVGAKLKIVLNPRGDQEGVLTKLKECESLVHRPLSITPLSAVFFCKDKNEKEEEGDRFTWEESVQLYDDTCTTPATWFALT